MAAYRFRYGGKRGKAFSLRVSPDHLVVRTTLKRELRSVSFGTQAIAHLADFEPVSEYAHCGVTLLKAPGDKAKARARRDQARKTLKQDSSVRFAGRPLCDPKSGEPVLYTENLFIKFDDECKRRRINKLLKDAQLSVKRALPYANNAFFVGAAEGTGLTIFDMALQLLAVDEVELCHPELVALDRPRAAFAEQWHLKKTTIHQQLIDAHANVESAWALSQGEGVTIAIIDDGVDLTHEELAGAGKIVAPRDVTRKNNTPSPGRNDNHGTACAGVALANGSIGASGVAPKATLMPIRLASGLGSQAEADAIHWAATNGADVISCSWGPKDGRWWDPRDPNHQKVNPLPDSTRLALDWATEHGRNGKGCVITWAAGNGNESVDNDGYASYERVIAVGASNDMGTRSAYSDFGKALWCCFPSNHGSASKTPGIWTTDRTGNSGYNPGNDSRGNYTDSFGGTSSACPGVAGVAALILARNPALRWDQIRTLLKDTADKIDEPHGQYDESGHSVLYGYGRVNAAQAVAAAAPPRPKYRALHTAYQDVPIEDLKTSTLSIDLAESATLADIVVHVDIEHTYRGDLIVRLLPPDGLGQAPVLLHNATGASEANLKQAYDVSNAPGLQALQGLSPAGRWTLSVQDQEERDQGQIKSFGLELVF